MKFILTVLILLCTVACFAQRHIKGIKAFELGGGISKYGQIADVGYIHFLSRKIYAKANAFFATDQSQGLKHRSLGFDASFLYSLPVYKNIFFASVKGGLSLVRDYMNTDATTSNLSAFKTGGLAGVEFETYLSDSFSIILDGDQRYLSGKLFGDSRYYLTFGFRYHVK